MYDHHDLAPELYLARFNGEGKPLVYSALRGLEWLSLRIANRVIASNQFYKSFEMERAQVPDGRITVVRNGPDLFRWRPLSSSSTRPNGKIMIVYVGILGFQDGVDYLVRALAHLAYDLHRTEFCCHIVGAGDALPMLKELTQKLGLCNRVSFTGWQEPEEVMRYIHKADIGVVPEPSNSHKDYSSSMALMEYMASGKAVVAFDLPELSAKAQDAAIYAHPNDPLALARKIAQLMEEPETRNKLGTLGRMRVERQLAWAHQAKELLKAYDGHLLESRSSF